MGDEKKEREEGRVTHYGAETKRSGKELRKGRRGCDGRGKQGE